MEILKVEGITKIFGKDENIVTALDDVSFTVTKGQMVAITGTSGAGKSTLLHIIGGVEKPTKGKVFLGGEDVFSKNDKNLAVFRRRQVGLVYQFYNLIPMLTAEENIILPSQMDGRRPDESRLRRLAEMMGISDRLSHLPSQLSGGQQQRVSVCRALYSSPMLLLADEPTGNLDSKNSHEILELLKLSHKKYGQTLIVITHDSNIALQADRIITINDGKIASDRLLQK